MAQRLMMDTCLHGSREFLYHDAGLVTPLFDVSSVDSAVVRLCLRFIRNSPQRNVQTSASIRCNPLSSYFSPSAHSFFFLVLPAHIMKEFLVISPLEMFN